MITCEFHGRLGNNLFQIATAASLSHKLGVDFILPEFTEAGHRGNLYVDLTMFGYDFNRGVYTSEATYNEVDFGYRPIEAVDNLKIAGFFQSWKYFEDIKDKLLNTYFTPSREVLERLFKYTISDHSLGISVRRGDYLMLQDNHCVIDASYYQSVIDKYFQNNIDQIFIFSDDIDWCKKVFGLDVNYVEDTAGTQLFLMSKMKNLILSNSTFAWWGAYLNQNNGTIIAPDPWFGSAYINKNTEDLYYKTWIKETHHRIYQNYTLTQNMFN